MLLLTNYPTFFQDNLVKAAPERLNYSGF